MPINGETNNKFGVYRSVCCGSEIVIATGAVFPDCPRHPHLPTTWKATSDEKIHHVFDLPESKKRGDSAA